MSIFLWRDNWKIYIVFDMSRPSFRKKLQLHLGYSLFWPCGCLLSVVGHSVYREETDRETVLVASLAWAVFFLPSVSPIVGKGGGGGG